MYKRSAKPLNEFINLDVDAGCYYIDTQFGTLTYMKEIAGAISTRVSAGCAIYIAEVYDG